MEPKTSSRFYLTFVSVVFFGSFLVIYFAILPRLTEIFSKFSPGQAEALKHKLFYLAIGYLPLLFLLNVYVWKKEIGLDREEAKIRRNLELMPNNLAEQNKLKELQKKRERTIGIVEPLVVFMLGIFVAFFVVSMMMPLFETMSGVK